MALLALGLAILLPGLALRIYMGSGAEDRLAPQEAVSIPELRSPLPKNGFLACPSGYCSAAGYHEPGLRLAVGAAARLLDRNDIGRNPRRACGRRSRATGIRIYPALTDISVPRSRDGRVGLSRP